MFFSAALITRHVDKGSTIYSDGWKPYEGLDKVGYNHRVVNHKHSFKCYVKDDIVGDWIDVHTNR